MHISAHNRAYIYTVAHTTERTCAKQRTQQSIHTHGSAHNSVRVHGSAHDRAQVCSTVPAALSGTLLGHWGSHGCPGPWHTTAPGAAMLLPCKKKRCARTHTHTHTHSFLRDDKHQQRKAHFCGRQHEHLCHPKKCVNAWAVAHKGMKCPGDAFTALQDRTLASLITWRDAFKALEDRTLASLIT